MEQVESRVPTFEEILNEIDEYCPAKGRFFDVGAHIRLALSLASVARDWSPAQPRLHGPLPSSLYLPCLGSTPSVQASHTATL